MMRFSTTGACRQQPKIIKYATLPSSLPTTSRDPDMFVFRPDIDNDQMHLAAIDSSFGGIIFLTYGVSMIILKHPFLTG